MDEPKHKTSTFGLTQRNQYIIVGALAAVLGSVLIFQLARRGEATAGPAPAEAEEAAPLPASALPGPAAVPAEPKAIACAATIEHDPFTMPKLLRDMLDQQAKPKGEAGKPPAARGPDPAVLEQARSLALKGIIGNSSGRIAYINDSPVQAGAAINGFTVVEVREKSVLLKKDQTEVTLELNRPATKRGDIPPEPSTPQNTGGNK